MSKDDLFKWDSGKAAAIDTSGLVTGPASAVDGNLVVFDTTTGKKIKDAGSAPHAAVTLDANAGAILGLTGQQVTLDNQNANLILAGPGTGSAAAPTFRALVQADLPATWQTWSPTFTGYSSNPTGGVYRYCIVGKICHFLIREPNTGTSNAASLTISAPVQAATITGATWLVPAAISDNGVTLTTWGRGRIGSGESAFTFGINPAVDGGFTTSGGKRVAAFEGFYEIA